jgi:hypothetical protein
MAEGIRLNEIGYSQGVRSNSKDPVAGLVPAIHVFAGPRHRNFKTSMPGSSPGKAGSTEARAVQFCARQQLDELNRRAVER